MRIQVCRVFFLRFGCLALRAPQVFDAEVELRPGQAHGFRHGILGARRQWQTRASTRGGFAYLSIQTLRLHFPARLRFGRRQDEGFRSEVQGGGARGQLGSTNLKPGTGRHQLVSRSSRTYLRSGLSATSQSYIPIDWGTRYRDERRMRVGAYPSPASGVRQRAPGGARFLRRYAAGISTMPAPASPLPPSGARPLGGALARSLSGAALQHTHQGRTQKQNTRGLRHWSHRHGSTDARSSSRRPSARVARVSSIG